VFVAARRGDEAARKTVRRLLSQKLFPGTQVRSLACSFSKWKLTCSVSSAGVDLDVLDETHQATTFEKILSQPELMHFIDQDKHMSEAFRTGLLLPRNGRSA
jgi:hypothetical protein